MGSIKVGFGEAEDVLSKKKLGDCGDSILVFRGVGSMKEKLGQCLYQYQG